MPLILTLLIAKISQKLSRLLGRGSGSALPGLIAERLDPGIAGKLAAKLPEGCLVITGTNGKTTATKMLAAILQQNGHKVLTNQSGSNLTRGIASALIDATNAAGGVNYDLGVFEVDEATMPAACKLLKPKAVIVLNLFRDQLDRYGELDTTAAVIGSALKGLKADIWLNADDPLVASLMSYPSHDSKVRYFGVEQSPVRRLNHDVAADSNHCPLCGEALEYSVNFYGHIGHWQCTEGHISRPKPEVWLKQSKAKSELGLGKDSAVLELKLDGLYNAYNALAAAAGATSLGVGLTAATQALSGVEAAFGRVESFDYRGRRVWLLLIKNPTGFNQVIQTFLTGKDAKHLLIAVNDNFADGRDVSWLWDVGFEEINPEAQVLASGVRGYDLALRLKYAGRPAPDVKRDLDKAFDKAVALAPEGESVYILPTYTAMLGLRRTLERKGGLKPWR